MILGIILVSFRNRYQCQRQFGVDYITTPKYILIYLFINCFIIFINFSVCIIFTIVNPINLYPGNNCLMGAARRGFIDVIKILLKYGIDINVKNNSGK